MSLFLIGEIMFAQDAPSEKHISYRPSTVAGTFYSANPDALRKELEAYLDLENPLNIPTQEKILGIVSPHAGYIYSGFVAGKVYRELKNREINTAIIIAPSHRQYFSYSSVFSGDAYVTSLGPAKVDKELAFKLTQQNNYVRLSMDGHDWKSGAPEHSLEVQIPFLQYLFPEIKIVPIVMGSQDPQIIHSLTMAIYSTLKEIQRNDIILIASTDLSHYHNYKTAYEIDSNFINSFKRFDYFKLIASLNSKKIEACGLGPVAVVMCASEALGANKPVSIYYGTSGDSPFVSSSKDKVVGYFSGALTYSSDFSESCLPDFTEQEKNKLLEFVKKAIHSKVLGLKFEISEEFKKSKNFMQDYTAFVTIEKEGRLRACMGHLFPTKPFIFELLEVSEISSTSDWRFGPIRKEELPNLQFEITILSRFKKVFSFNKIQIGKHGLYLRLKNNSGLLLPQVAVERNWDVNTFLQNLCLKAGVSKTAYLEPESELYLFEALIIH